jgi:sulfur carrier protein
VRVKLNGKQEELEPGTTIAALVERLAGGADGRGIAVAVDSEVVPRSAWSRTELSEGQQVEVLGAIQGG